MVTKKQGTLARVGNKMKAATKKVAKKAGKALKPVTRALAGKGKKTSPAARKRTTKAGSKR
jgi:hypothetical protein